MLYYYETNLQVHSFFSLNWNSDFLSNTGRYYHFLPYNSCVGVFYWQVFVPIDTPQC